MLYIADMSGKRRKVVLVQLPIPPVGNEPIRGNVPLAAGYLKLMAQMRGLEGAYDIEILPTRWTNTLGDQALVSAIVERRPWLVGFSCYLWNIDRTLWVAERLKQAGVPHMVIGGPEITADNGWVLDHPAVDFAVVGEGEQSFVELLECLRSESRLGRVVNVPGVIQPGHRQPLLARKPLPKLDDISSPYLHGILDAADEEMLMLETIRGCVFKCKFCFYPKSYDGLYFLSEEKTRANLRHAAQRGAREVVLLDPTLNQRRDFASFLRVLAEENPHRRFKYFGELRAEGITPEIAGLLQAANFPEVEIGLQSIDPQAMEMMDRKNNLKAFERGVTALLAAGIQVKVDLIIGLPGDTTDSVRRGLHYLRDSELYSSVQVFNLAILPGTAFREEAGELGLRYSPRTPYYVTATPTLTTGDLYELMAEAQELFSVDFDSLPPPKLPLVPNAGPNSSVADVWQVDLTAPTLPPVPPPDKRALAFTLWLRSPDFDAHQQRAAECVRRLLTDNPHTTLQIILECTDTVQRPSLEFLRRLWCECLEQTSYLDRFYSILPGPVRGAKRLVILWPESQESPVADECVDELEQYATVVQREETSAIPQR